MTTDHDAVFELAEFYCLLAVENPLLRSKYDDAHAAALKLEHSGWKRKNGMTQNQKIVSHLQKAGSITVREAIVEYSIQSLTKRINELRDAGYPIISDTRFHPVTNQKYVRYSFADFGTA